jgi:hypothetical protein
MGKAKFLKGLHPNSYTLFHNECSEISLYIKILRQISPQLVRRVVCRTSVEKKKKYASQFTQKKSIIDTHFFHIHIYLFYLHWGIYDNVVQFSIK